MNEQRKVALADEQAAVAEVKKPKRAKARRWGLMLALPLIVAAAGLYFYMTSGKTVSTDNAYVKQDIVSVSTQVNGPVSEVFVRENQRVKFGQPLYRVDPAPTEVALMQAQAQLSAAELQTQQLRVEASGTGADISGAQADLAINRRALDREATLMRQGFTTKVRYDDALSEVRKSETELANARARAANASAAIAPGGNQPAIAAARAAIAKSELDLRHGLVRSPADGIVSKSERLLIGQTAITGVSMLSVVRDKAPWVEANFKEGDLAKMAIGQAATVEFDAYPELKVKSHVCSIGAGTGSEFSVLPAQNANGNWVKVTQRVPVRICFDEKPTRQMIAGLSAKVDVRLDGKK